jgi:ActR/RegA family two-component response regulator
MRHVPAKLLVLDQDENVLRQVGRVFGGYFVVVPVHTPHRAMGLLEGDPHIRVMITEQVMRAAQGVDLLEAVRARWPEVRRVMLTTYTDLASIVTGLHSGAVQVLVQKPASDDELLKAVCPEVMHQISTAAHSRRASA